MTTKRSQLNILLILIPHLTLLSVSNALFIDPIIEVGTHSGHTTWQKERGG
jgi:hypothetical protein